MTQECQLRLPNSHKSDYIFLLLVYNSFLEQLWIWVVLKVQKCLKLNTYALVNILKNVENSFLEQSRYDSYLKVTWYVHCYLQYDGTPLLESKNKI